MCLQCLSTAQCRPKVKGWSHHPLQWYASDELDYSLSTDDQGVLLTNLTAELAVADGAALTAWILRKEMPMSWGRGGVILASAAAGAFGGLGVEALIEGEETTPAFLVLFMAAGAYTGAITAAWTTGDFDRSWGEDSPRATLASRDSGVVPVPVVIPTDGGGLGGFAFTW